MSIESASTWQTIAVQTRLQQSGFRWDDGTRYDVHCYWFSLAKQGAPVKETGRVCLWPHRYRQPVIIGGFENAKSGNPSIAEQGTQY